MLHIVKQLKSAFVLMISLGLNGNDSMVVRDDLENVDENKDRNLSGKELKEYNGEKAEEIKEFISNSIDGTIDDLADEDKVNINALLLRQGKELVKVMKTNSEESDTITVNSQESVSELKEEVSLSQIDVTKFTRTLKRGDSGEDVAELNKFLMLKFNTKDNYKSNINEFDDMTWALLRNYQSQIGYKNPDGVLTISKTKEYNTLKNIKKDIAGAKTSVEQKQISKVEKQQPAPVVDLNPVDNQVAKETTNETIKTIERTENNTDTYFGFSSEKLIDNVNADSFNKIIKGMSFNELFSYVKEMRKVSKNYRETIEKDGNKETIEDYTPFSYSMKEFFTGTKENPRDEKTKYEAQKSTFDWGFGGIELASLINLFENAYITQLNVRKSTDYKQKLTIALDYNADGLLDNKKGFYTYEKELYENIETKEEFSNLLLNIGYDSVEDFNNQFSENYTVAREVFKSRLGRTLAVENPINPGELLRSPNALSEFNLYKQDVLSKADEVIDNHKYTKDLPEEIKNKIKVQAVGLVLGSQVGAGVSFDIQEVTSNILDSLAFGVVNGVPGIGIAKSLVAENGRLGLSLGAVNLIPMVGAFGVIKESQIEEYDRLFDRELDSTMQITVLGSISTVGSMVGIDFSKFDIETKKGINQAVEDMDKALDKVFEDIEDGKTFEESKFSENPEDKSIYQGLAKIYKQGEHNIDFIKEGSLNSYKRELFERAEKGGLNYVGTTIGLAFVSGYLPIPLVLVHGEKHSVKWEEVGSYSKNEGNIDSHLEGKEELLSNLAKYKDAFNSKTRYNKGALAYMEPSNSVEKRWEGLVRLSRQPKILRESGFPDFLKTVEEEDRWLVLSTATQYMKKANDYDNGDIDSWNNKTEKFINIDKKRRGSFNEIFGFNTDIYAEKYNKELLKSKGNIGETTIKGLGFDASASRNVEGKTIHGVDTLFAELSMLTVNNKPLLIDIDKQSDIDAFITKTENDVNMPPEMKKQLIEGLKNGNIELKFYKDPEGFDDRIMPVVKGTDKIIQVLRPEFNTLNVGIGWMAEKEAKDKTGDLTSEPGEEGEEITDNTTGNESTENGDNGGANVEGGADIK